MNENNYNLPKFPKIVSDEEKLDNFWGDKDPAFINSELIKNILDLKAINDELIKIDRKKVMAELTYKRKYRKVYLEQPSSRSETWKKTSSEIACEKEEIKLTYLKEMSSELNRKAQELRARLETLKNISFNLREEMRL